MTATAILRAPLIQADPTHPIFGPVGDDSTIVVRPSQIEQHDNCSLQEAYVRRGIRPEFENATLIFGTVVHDVVFHHVTNRVRADETVSYFSKLWAEASQTKVIRYSRDASYESLLGTGKRLMELFPDWYKNCGIRPLTIKGEFACEIRFNVEIAPKVILSAQPDFIGEVTKILTDERGFVMAAPGQIACLDWKTPRCASSIAFAQRAKQPTYYKIVGDAHRSLLGDEVARVGFVELLKKKVPTVSRGTGPLVCTPFLYPRSKELVAEALRKAVEVADRIRKGIISRDSRMAWNTPCNMCDYAGACLSGNADGLVLPKGVTPSMLLLP